MNTTLNILVNCYNWEKSKEDALDGLNQLKNFINGLTDGWADYDSGFFKEGEQISKEMFFVELDSFMKKIDKICENDEDNCITFSSLDGFAIATNDIENGELDFDDSLSLVVAYGTVVDCIKFQMKINSDTCDLNLTEHIENHLTGYGDILSGSANDTYGDYIEEIE
jgi:hypothetical protein